MRKSLVSLCLLALLPGLSVYAADEIQRLYACKAKMGKESMGIDIYLWPQSPEGYVALETGNVGYMVKAKGKFSSDKVQALTDPFEVTFDFSGTVPENAVPYQLSVGKGRDKKGTMKFTSRADALLPAKEVQADVTCTQVKSNLTRS